MSKVNRRSQSISSKPCLKCGKNVFQLEKIIVGDHSLHESCFVCKVCDSRLSTGNYAEVNSNFYCLQHSLEVLKTKEADQLAEDTGFRTDLPGGSSFHSSFLPRPFYYGRHALFFCAEIRRRLCFFGPSVLTVEVL